MATQHDKIMKDILAFQDKVMRGSMVAVGTQIIQKSPVDTGAFRSSWFFAVGLPSDEKSDGGRDSASALKIEAQSIKVGQVGYFVNNQPYSIKLEYGSSQQAPTGMVRITVANWQDIVNQTIRRLG